MLFRVVFFVLSFFTIILPLSSYAQLISSEIYETEEDLQEGLESGLLTFDQYLELLDLIQAKVMPSSEEVDKLEFVPDVSHLELLQIEEKIQDENLSLKTGSFLEKSQEKITKLSGRAVWRFYEPFHDEGGAENYLFCEITSNERIIWHVEAEQRVNSSDLALSRRILQFRKRFVKFLFPQHTAQIIIGNFDKRIGLGLNIGYHSLFGYSSDPDLKSKDSFLYPLRGRNNGIFAESKFKSFSFLAFYSKNKREIIEDQIGAFDLTYTSKGFDVGLSFSEGELKNIENKNKFRDDCRSLHFDVNLRTLKFSGEYALLANRKSGLAFDLFSSRKRYSFDFSGWRYEDDFIHPHGGGISNLDYESIYLEEIDYPYKSRQAGERGIFFKSRYNMVGKLNFYFSFSQWRERSYQPDKMKLRIGTGYDFSRALSFVVYHQWSDLDVEDEATDQKTTTLDLFFLPYSKLNFNFISNYRRSDDKDYGDLRLRMDTQIFSPFAFLLWLKYNDPNFSHSSDEYFSFHIQERIELHENYLAISAKAC